MKLGMYQKQPLLITDPDKREGRIITNVASLQELINQETPLTIDKLTLGQKLTYTGQQLEAPIAFPRQIFAVGFNYHDHTAELKTSLPSEPSIFTKFVSSLTGPMPTVTLPNKHIDWETELVIVIGKGGRQISKEDAPKHIAGYMVGQDLSDRHLQFINAEPQFSLAKSYQNFSPVGPWLTTPDELFDFGDLHLTTRINDDLKQDSILANLIFDGSSLINCLSSIVEFYPGDLIFTGTPGGVGVSRNPQEFLQPGDCLTAQIDCLGQLTIELR